MEFTENIEFNNCPTAHEELELHYRGFLCNSEELTIVYGFSEAWNHTTELPMEKTTSGFSVKLKMLDFETFHFCFRNSHYEWDNNHHCNYVASIAPALVSVQETRPTFDINKLIDEMLEPLIPASSLETTVATPIQITTKPVNLGTEISNFLSTIPSEAEPENLKEYSTLDEILTCTVIKETPVSLEPTNALLTLEDSFIISPRKLSKFYLLRKQIKLGFYKLFVKIPKLIFGSEKES